MEYSLLGLVLVIVGVGGAICMKIDNIVAALYELIKVLRTLHD